MIRQTLLAVLLMSVMFNVWGCKKDSSPPKNQAKAAAPKNQSETKPAPSKNQDKTKADPPRKPAPQISPDMAGKVKAVFGWARMTSLADRRKLTELRKVQARQLVQAIVLRYSLSPEPIRPMLADSLRRLGDGVVVPLVAGLSDPDLDFGSYYAPGIREEYPDLLARISDKRAVKPLIAALFDEQDVSRAVAAALDKLDPNWRETPTACRMSVGMIALLQGGDVSSAPPGPFAAKAKGIKRWAQEDPCEVIGRSYSGYSNRPNWRRQPKPKETARQIERIYLCWGAASAMEHLGSKQSVKPLAAALAEMAQAGEMIPEQAGRAGDAICSALGKLDPNWHQSPEGKAAVSRFCDLLNQRDETVQRMAVNILGQTGSPKAANALLAHFQAGKDRSGYFRHIMSKRSYSEGLVSRTRLFDMVGRLSSTGRALARLADKRCVKPLIRITKNKDGRLRYEATVILGHVGGKEAVNALLEMLKHPDKEMQVRAICALGHTKSDAAVAPLVQVLEKGRIAPEGKSAEAAFDQLPEAKRTRLIKRYGSREEAIKMFAERLPEGHVLLRNVAAGSLGNLGLKQAVKPLCRTVGDRDPALNIAAIEALGQLRDASACPTLIEALKHTDPGVCTEAILALKQLGDKSAVGPLIEILKKKYDEDEKATGREDDRMRLLRRMRRGEKSDTDLAAEALGALGSKEAIGPLVLALSADVKPAFAALFQIDPHWNKSNEARKTVPALIKRLKSPNATTTNVIILLSIIGDKRALEPLMELAGQSDNSETLIPALNRLEPRWRKSPLAARQVPRLIKQLEDAKPPKAPDKDARLSWEQQQKQAEEADRRLDQCVEAAGFLGEIGDKSAVKPLIECFKRFSSPPKDQPGRRRLMLRRGFDEGICAACATALGKMKSTDAVEPLTAIFKAISDETDKRRDRWTRRRESDVLPNYSIEVACALGEIGDRRTVKPLLRVFKMDSDSHMSSTRYREEGGQHYWPRRSIGLAAAGALARIGGDEAADGMIKALSQPHFRYAVAPALAKMGRKKAVGPLIATLHDEKNHVCLPVIRALDGLDPKWRTSSQAGDAMASLIQRFLDEENLPRINWRRPLDEMEDTASSPVLFALKHLDPNWRTSDLAKAAVKRLHRRLKADPDTRQAGDAICMLAVLRNPDSVPVLIGLLPRCEEDTQKLILRSLGAIDQAWPKSKAAGRIVPALVANVKRPIREDFATHRSATFRTQLDAAKVLGMIGTPQAKAAIMDAVRSNALSRSGAMKKFDPKIDPFRDEWRRRYSDRLSYGQDLMKTLADCLDRKDADALLAELKNPNSLLLNEVECMTELAPEKVGIKPILAAVRHDDRNLHKIGVKMMSQWLNYVETSPEWYDSPEAGAVVPDLIQILKTQGPYVRERVIPILKELNDPRSVEPLIAVLNESLRLCKEGIKKAGGTYHFDRYRPKELELRQNNLWMTAMALGRLADPKALGPLKEALKFAKDYKRFSVDMEETLHESIRSIESKQKK